MGAQVLASLMDCNYSIASLEYVLMQPCCTGQTAVALAPYTAQTFTVLFFFAFFLSLTDNSIGQDGVYALYGRRLLRKSFAAM